MERRNFLQRLLEIQLRLLCSLPQYFDRPTRLVAKEREELVEELVLGHACHTLEGALFRFRFRALHERVRRGKRLEK